MALGAAIIKLILLRKKIEDPHLPSGPVLFIKPKPSQPAQFPKQGFYVFPSSASFIRNKFLHLPDWIVLVLQHLLQKAKFNQNWRQTASTGTKNHGTAATGWAFQQGLMRRRVLMEMFSKDTPIKPLSKGMEEFVKHDSERPGHH